MVLVYAALFAGELGWQSVTPLIPSYIERFSLTDTEGSLMLSAASLGILLVSIPAGWVTRHASPRLLTLSALAVVALANTATALAPVYPLVVAARLLFGLGFGVLWVSVTAWLADAAGEHRARALATTTAVVGVGSVLGPAYAGWLAATVSLVAPFVGLAVATGLLLVALLLDRSGTGKVKEPAPPLSDLTHALGRDPDLRTMILLTIAGAVVWMTADLLLPLRFDAAGFGAGAIGLAFTLGSVVFASTSAVVSRRADRWATPRNAMLGSVLLAAFTAVPALLGGIPAAFAFLLGAGLATGITAALTYPFGLHAVARGRVTVGVITALANVIWAVSGLVGPIVGGAFSQSVGDQAAFAVLALVCVVVAMAVGRRTTTAV